MSLIARERNPREWQKQQLQRFFGTSKSQFFGSIQAASHLSKATSDGSHPRGNTLTIGLVPAISWKVGWERRNMCTRCLLLTRIIVIPLRDPTTLESAGRYFILFPNPAYARTYQNHVIRLHRIAKTHTPTSIESPLPLQPGVVIEGEDVYTLLQDYSLCPPSQRIQLRLLFPSYSARIKQVLDQRGYRPLLGETNKTGRSVLFSVDGQQLPTSVIRNTIAADGRDRGLAWDISIDRLDTSRSAADGFEGSTSTETDEFAELGARRHTPARWVMSFSNENEARRFIRAWHRRPFPPARADDPALVQAEFIW